MSINDITWISQSYAKINLGLQVLHRLPNGYHEISTGFCFINWSDRFEIKKASSFTLDISDNRLTADHTNLIVKAVRTLGKYVHFDDAYAVYLDKVIPIGAGLGGGSSNAATILRMLDKANGLGISTEDLSQFVSGLGTDIPVFLHGKPAIGSGIGTNITFCDIQPNAWIVTVFPEIHISTAEVYQNCIPNDTHEFSLKDILLHEPLEEWRYLLTNDLEPWVIHQHPIIGDIRDQLYELGAVYAAMSGSGSSVFGLFEQEFVAVDAYNLLVDWKMHTNITPPSFAPDFGIYRNT